MGGRDKVIAQKTQELIKFRELSGQFSPQVIDAVRMGSINLGSRAIRRHVCAVHVEIHEFSERISRLEHEQAQVLLDKFLKDSTSIFMRHGVTLDRFLGYGITGFTNAPLEREDYVVTALNAVLALKFEIEKLQSEYLDHWLKEFNVRVGIVPGPAAVGFFGHQAARRYSAMGRPVELARQIAQLAQPGEILCSGDLSMVRGLPAFEFRDRGRRVVPGYGDDLISLSVVERATSSIGDMPTIDG